MNRLFGSPRWKQTSVARGQETLVVNDAIGPRRVNTCKRLYNGCRSAAARLADRFPIISHVNDSALHNLSSSLRIGHEEFMLPLVCGRDFSPCRAPLYSFNYFLTLKTLGFTVYPRFVEISTSFTSNKIRLEE